MPAKQATPFARRRAAVAGSYRLDRGILRFHNGTVTVPSRPGRPAIPSLTIKNIPLDLLDALKGRAAENHRSLNGEVLLALRCAVLAPKRDPEKIIARIEALKASMDLKPVSAAFIRKAIREGRP